MDLVQGAVGRGRWRQSSLGGSPTGPWLGLVEKTCNFWECRALGSTKGTSPECWGVLKALQQLLLSFLDSEHRLNRAQSQTWPPGWHPRVSKSLHWCLPHWTFLSTRAPQNAFPLAGRAFRINVGTAKKKIHVLLNPVSRSNSAPPSKKPLLGSQGWVRGRRKGFFTANREWERSKESVQAVGFEWHMDNRQESKQGTLPASLTATARVCAALQRCTQFLLYLKVPRFNWRGNVQQLSCPCCVTVGKCSLWNGSLWKQGWVVWKGFLAQDWRLARE